MSWEVEVACLEHLDIESVFEGKFGVTDQGQMRLAVVKVTTSGLVT